MSGHQKLSLEPHRAKPTGHTESAWWYEDETGIDVCVGKGGSVDTCRILWRHLLAAAKRCGRLREGEGA